MTIRDLLQSLKPNEAIYVKAPPLQLEVTSTILTTIGQRGLIEVIYEDLTEERRVADATILDMDASRITLMDLVSFVQAGSAIKRQVRAFDVNGDSRMTGDGHGKRS